MAADDCLLDWHHGDIEVYPSTSDFEGEVATEVRFGDAPVENCFGEPTIDGAFGVVPGVNRGVT